MHKHLAAGPYVNKTSPDSHHHTPFNIGNKLKPGPHAPCDNLRDPCRCNIPIKTNLFGQSPAGLGDLAAPKPSQYVFGIFIKIAGHSNFLDSRHASIPFAKKAAAAARVHGRGGGLPTGDGRDMVFNFSVLRQN